MEYRNTVLCAILWCVTFQASTRLSAQGEAAHLLKLLTTPWAESQRLYSTLYRVDTRLLGIHTHDDLSTVDSNKIKTLGSVKTVHL